MRFIRSSRPELPSPCHCFVSSFVPGAATDVEPGQLAGLIIDTLIMGSWRSDPETDGEDEPERCSRPAHQVRRQMSNDDRSESAANEESSGWGEHSGPQHGSSRDEHGSRHERSDPEKHILDRIGGRDTRVHENGPRLDKFTPRAEGRAWADLPRPRPNWRCWPAAEESRQRGGPGTTPET
jgi:hypothetical protein